MRKDPQAFAHPVLVSAPTRETPLDWTAERELEPAYGLAGDRINHLLMELRIGFGWIESATDQNRRIVEVDRTVVALVGGVVIHYGEVPPDGTGPERFVADIHGHIVAKGPSLSGIEGIGLQRSDDRIFEVDLAPYVAVGDRLHRLKAEIARRASTLSPTSPSCTEGTPYVVFVKLPARTIRRRQIVASTTNRGIAVQPSATR